MTDASQVAHHHSKTVVKRHRNTQTVVGRKADLRTDEMTIIHDVAVSEGGSFRGAGRSACKLDIDRVFVIERCGYAPYPSFILLFQERPKGHKSVKFLHTKTDQSFQRGQIRQSKFPQHCDIIARLEACRTDQRLATNLVERILNLGRSICRVYVDENDADPRRSQLRQNPF